DLDLARRPGRETFLGDEVARAQDLAIPRRHLVRPPDGTLVEYDEDVGPWPPRPILDQYRPLHGGALHGDVGGETVGGRVALQTRRGDLHRGEAEKRPASRDGDLPLGEAVPAAQLFDEVEGLSAQPHEDALEPLAGTAAQALPALFVLA